MLIFGQTTMRASDQGLAKCLGRSSLLAVGFRRIKEE